MKNRRILLGPEKPRVNDACRIAGSLDAKPPDTVAMRKEARRRNRAALQGEHAKGRKEEREPGAVHRAGVPAL